MRCQLYRKLCLLISRFYPLSLSRCEVQQFQWKQFHLPNSIFYLLRKRERSPTDTPKISPSGFSNEVSGNPFPTRVNPRPKKIDFLYPQISLSIIPTIAVYWKQYLYLLMKGVPHFLGTPNSVTIHLTWKMDHLYSIQSLYCPLHW